MNKLLALVSAIYAIPGVGSALASATIRYKPQHTDLFDLPLHVAWKKLEKISWYRTAAFITYAVISLKTENPTLLLIDLTGYTLPFAIEYGCKGLDYLKSLYEKLR